MKEISQDLKDKLYAIREDVMKAAEYDAEFVEQGDITTLEAIEGAVEVFYHKTIALLEGRSYNDKE